MVEHDTILKGFLDHCEKTPDAVWLTQPMGGDEIKTFTFKQVLEEAQKMAGYLESKGFEKGSKIAICSKNCAWWIIADIAIWISGHVSVPVYPTLTGDTVSYILEHSESKLLFVGKLDKKPWDEMKSGVPADMAKVSFPLKPEGDWGDTWDDVIGKTEPIKAMVERSADEMATIIYTSGSTGKPKGVMQNFKGLTVPTQGMVKLYNVNAKDRYLSYLPLSHGMERWLGECLPMYCGEKVWYADSLTTFVADLVRAKPTLFMSVPRLWTKFNQGVLTKMPEKKLNFLMSIPFIGWLVKRKVLKGLGLDCVRIAGSGSAPIPQELLDWYRRLGLNLLEGYGMTENFNYSHISMAGRVRPGYVGEPYADVQHRISDDGEIQVLSPGIMMGYYKNEEATKETMCDDGWLRTGDRGEIDEKNRLKITGRLKEIFKTSKGKYVSPAPIENKLNVSSRIELSCVSGSGHPQPMAIIQLSEAARKEAGEEKGRTAIEAELEELMKTVNGEVDPHEALQLLAIVKDEWQPENGFLTPTQKIKRGTIEDAYKGKYDEWYGAKKKVIWYGW
ncbi:7a-methyl-1,5-dioxo-octahydro-1H-inden-4-yl [Seminavis robusta]|uniref:7a-methyl-1,5-dioxo-octahydro-1H-inden-4-yl n=1 Tax=Seminavis robusta TaxID=568900 RepID=A0A9N8EXT8_9STRA|nr:7a-methyl-1,5-dioxo-octahydro-1H-inden-4-yl [Seminavis robusta]|eukprot:Sro2430_g327480.1 7a-methyl-1,5-dioxo-octahydro-1H-inden-4-yl (560) ;mRNA; f:9735-11779